MKINTTHFFVFIVSLILSLFIIILYSVLRPEFLKPRYNFSPFPSVNPSDIPDADINDIRKCTKNLTKCDPGVGCAMCGKNFSCTSVGEKENVMINNIKVPPGNWCLPEGKKDLGCGTYTGRAIWSERNDGGDLKQRWSCTCLYPDLFGGDNCLTHLACRDPSVSSDQSKNVLKSNDGHIWNPQDPDFDPKGTTPYDTDDKGDPLYQCSCMSGRAKGEEDQEKFVKMPGDPYRCHAEPCTSDHKIALWNPETNKCDCAAVQEGTFAHSNVTGKCITLPSNICTEWDSKNNVCVCPVQEKQMLCNNPKSMIRDTQKQCPDNPLGSYCQNPCKDENGAPVCKNGSFCTQTSQPPYYKCTCPTGGDEIISGVNCENRCYKNGTDIGTANRPELCCSKYAYEPCDSGGGGGACPGTGRWKCIDKPKPGKCIGSTTILITENGNKKLSNILPGEKILTWNFSKNIPEYQHLLCTYKHHEMKSLYSEHLEIITNNNDRIILSDNHRIYLQNNKDIQAKYLIIGDKIKTVSNYDTVKEINKINDIPLTPVLLNGNCITGKGVVTRCWSGTESNAELMDKLVKIVYEQIKNYDFTQIDSIIQQLYTKFKLSNKNINKIPSIFEKLGLNVNESIKV